MARARRPRSVAGFKHTALLYHCNGTRRCQAKRCACATLQLYADVVQLRVEVERMHTAFASDT